MKAEELWKELEECVAWTRWSTDLRNRKARSNAFKPESPKMPDK